MVLYPPFAMVALWMAGAMGQVLDGATSAVSIVLVTVKMYGIAGDILLSLLLVHLLRDRSTRMRVAAAAAIALNPAFWYVSAIWGQIDSIYVLLMVASIAALANGRFASGWAGWILSVGWKLQALALAPLIAARTLRVRGPAALVTYGLVTVGLVALLTIFLPAAGWDGYLARLWPAAGGRTISAFNSWYLMVALSDGLGGVAAGPPGSLRATVIGVALVAACAAAVAYATWRNSSFELALPAAALVIAAFVLLTGMRERYLLAAIPFMALVGLGWQVGAVDRMGLVAFCALTATQMINLLAVGSPAPGLWVNIFSSAAPGPLSNTIFVMGVVAAAANVAVLVWAMRRVIGAALHPAPRG